MGLSEHFGAVVCGTWSKHVNSLGVFFRRITGEVVSLTTAMQYCTKWALRKPNVLTAYPVLCGFFFCSRSAVHRSSIYPHAARN